MLTHDLAHERFQMVGRRGKPRAAPSPQAALGKGRGCSPGRAPRANPEEQLQRQVVEFLRFAAPDLIFFHPSNEAGSRRVGEMGRLKALGLRAGVSDLIFCLPDGCFGAIELKAPGGKATPDQNAFLRGVAAASDRAAVCCDVEGVETVLKYWGVPLRATLLHSGVFKRTDP